MTDALALEVVFLFPSLQDPRYASLRGGGRHIVGKQCLCLLSSSCSSLRCFCVAFAGSVRNCCVKLVEGTCGVVRCHSS